MDHATAISQLQKARLYAILDTGYSAPNDWPKLTEQLIAGGVGVIQIRAKKSSHEEIIAWTKLVQPITQDHHIPLIINDFPELVSITQADGVHIGQDDMAVNAARKLTGPDKIIGKSTHSLLQVRETASEKPDYIGFGPLFSTPTKPTYNPVGLQEISQVRDLIHAPVFCIGGIKVENISQVIEKGAQRVVIVSGLLTASSPTQYAMDIFKHLSRMQL
ncbi:MAG: thiamine phosphate synthase [Verrucomicrobiota bacterium]